MNKYILVFLVFLLGIIVSSCELPETNSTTTTTTTIEEKKIPNINRDSAYAFVKSQVDFGSRMPGTKAHKECSNWLKNKLESFGAKVYMQEYKADFYFGKSADAVNIVGAINPEKKRRVLLCAHWDSRFQADQDTERKNEAILGADDGASGVGVLLEIARVIQENPIDIGVDIIFFDAEDQGKDGDGTEDTSLTWCIGSQYWAKNKHVQGYKAEYGILLDMVGSKGARFGREDYSMQFAPDIMNKVWKTAKDMGYGDYFVDARVGGITDDHVFVNQGGVRTIDIINRPADGGFGKYWHTHDDNMDVISKKSLGAVGNVVLNVLYNE